MALPDPLFLIHRLWVAWLLSWFTAALWSSRAVRKVPARDIWLSHLAVTLGAALLFGGSARLFAAARLWRAGRDGGLALALVVLAALLFTWWGRVRLGVLWSGTITRKEAHRVVDSGPYAVVRHPIYTGLIVATLATAAAQATLPALAGCVGIAVGLWLKARCEESFLTRELGPDYEAYRRRVPMLIPFGPTAG